MPSAGLRLVSPVLPQAVCTSTQAAATTLRVIWQALVQPFLPYVFAVIVLMCLALATLVLALDRLVFGKAFHS